jgi:hypothetical protein
MNFSMTLPDWSSRIDRLIRTIWTIEIEVLQLGKKNRRLFGEVFDLFLLGKLVLQFDEVTRSSA